MVKVVLDRGFGTVPGQFQGVVIGIDQMFMQTDD